MKIKKNPHIGSSFDSFLKEEGIYEEVAAAATKRVISRRIQEEMRKKKISQTEMAQRMKTSRAALKRLLDPKNVSITLQTINRAAAVLGRDVEIKIK
jgi:antitoxin HicB